MVRFSLCCVSPQPEQAFPPLEPRCQPSPGGLAAPSLSRGFFAFGCVFWLLFLISVLLYAATGCGVKNTDVQKKPASGSLAPAFFSVSRQISVHVSLSLWLRGGRGEAVWSVEPAGPMSLHSWKNRETPLLLPASCLTLVLGTLQSGPAIPKHRCRGSPVWSQHPPARPWGSWSVAGFTHPCGSRGSSGQCCGFVICFLRTGSRNALMAGLGGKLCPHTTKEELPKVVQEQPRQVLKRGERDSCRCSYPHTGEVPREPKEMQGGAALGKTHQIYDLKWSLGGRLVGGS